MLAQRQADMLAPVNQSVVFKPLGFRGTTNLSLNT